MKIILVFKTHFDIGFTDLASNVIDQYAGSMLEQVIETCKGTQKLGKRNFVWTMPAWPLWHIVNHSEPKLKKELERIKAVPSGIIRKLPVKRKQPLPVNPTLSNKARKKKRLQTGVAYGRS